MNNPFIKKTNILSTIITIYLPFIFIILNLSDVLRIFGNSFIMIAALLVFVVLEVVFYFLSLIQGFRAINNGKVGPYRHAALSQIILYLLNTILSIKIMFDNRNSSDPFPFSANRVFLIIFLIIVLFAFIRRSKLKNQANQDPVSFRNPRLAWKLTLIYIVLPITFVAAVRGFYHLFVTYEIIRKILTIIGVIGFLFIIIVFVILIFAPLSDSPLIGASSQTKTPTSRPKTPTKISANDSTDKYINELDTHYEIEFKKITGSSPAMLDWKTIKDGPKNEAVKNLRRTMQNEAKKKGVEGKTKYF